MLPVLQIDLRKTFGISLRRKHFSLEHLPILKQKDPNTRCFRKEKTGRDKYNNKTTGHIKGGKSKTRVAASALIKRIFSYILEIGLVALMKCIGLTLYSSFSNPERQKKWLETTCEIIF